MNNKTILDDILIKKIIELCNKISNDMELGAELRKSINEYNELCKFINK